MDNGTTSIRNTVASMRDAVLFEPPERRQRLNRFWILLILSTIIASAGVVADSTATVIGAMIVAPMLLPIQGTMLSTVLGDRTNLVRSIALVIAGACRIGRHRLPDRPERGERGRGRHQHASRRPGEPRADGSSRGTGNRCRRVNRAHPPRHFRHAPGRRHSNLPGPAPGRRRAHPRIGGLLPSARGTAAVHHQRRRDPCNGHCRDGFLRCWPGPSDQRPRRGKTSRRKARQPATRDPCHRLHVVGRRNPAHDFKHQQQPKCAAGKQSFARWPKHGPRQVAGSCFRSTPPTTAWSVRAAGPLPLPDAESLKKLLIDGRNRSVQHRPGASPFLQSEARGSLSMPPAVQRQFDTQRQPHRGEAADGRAPGSVQPREPGTPQGTLERTPTGR